MADTGSATRRAYDAILDGILRGNYEPGTMLGEAGLAAEIGVSRTPVRTALALLQDEGWITVYPKRGALVRGLSARDVRDLADARLIIESTAVQRATSVAHDALVSRLSAQIHRQRASLADRDAVGFIELTIEFHRAFVEAGDNRVMLELYDKVGDRQRFLLLSYGETLLTRCEAIIAEHHTMVEKIKAHDTGGFAELLRTHLSDTYHSELHEVCQNLPASS
ncbi:GntR family transcriptional regulator [Mycobacterium sp. 141]|uniref:GntR family transcriptional regulator n=1 Tax=Mycobacterium sp. 141 TaxID=1120797 RepID=UPI000563842D|nr:GntR family transcriptional regulator [Mycobacterium sp. 141]